MNFNNINKKIAQGDLLLKTISDTDRNFINGLFSDNEIKKYYIVPKKHNKTIENWWIIG